MKRPPILIGCVVAGIMVTSCAGASASRTTTPATPETQTTSGTSSDISATRPPASVAPGPLQTIEAMQQHFVDVVAVVRPSVVEISTNKGLGSGIVYDAQGDIVTNNHVVGNAQSFDVTWFNGTDVKATLVGTDPSNDLAVIRVKSTAPNVRAATFTNSDALRTGDIALAIGNPLGLQSTVTEGIVSATGRSVAEDSSVTLPSTIQTSAAINPGNSGGALVDIRGQVIGIPTLAAADPQLGGGAAPGIGFAIPSNTVKQVADRLITSS